LIEKSFDIDNMSIQESEKYSESRSDIDKTFEDLRVDFDLPANKSPKELILENFKKLNPSEISDLV